MELTKQHILEAKDLVKEKVPAPEWAPAGHKPEEGVPYVWVRSLPVGELDAFQLESIDRKKLKAAADAGEEDVEADLGNMRARLCARCICDAGGNPLFDEDEVLLLAQKSAKPMNRIFKVAQRLAGLTRETVDFFGPGSNGQAAG